MSVIINTGISAENWDLRNWEMVFRASGDLPKHLTFDDAKELINAYSFMSHQLRPTPMHLTIRWSKCGLFNARDWMEVQGRLLDKMTRWLKRNGIIAVFMWAREVGGKMGANTHVLLHLPPKHWVAFMTFMTLTGQFDQRGDPSGTGLHLTGGVFGMMRRSMSAGVVQYMLKGLDPNINVRSDGKIAPLMDALGVDDRGERRLPIAGKRIGTSASIGATRRASMGWPELSTPEELHAALHPPAARGRH